MVVSIRIGDENMAWKLSDYDSCCGPHYANVLFEVGRIALFDVTGVDFRQAFMVFFVFIPSYCIISYLH